ncbi:reverse transcriptase domain-containing protein [Tanacetum coccineum]
MMGRPRSMCGTLLNIRDGCRLSGNKKIGQARERNKASKKESEKTGGCRDAEEVHYPVGYLSKIDWENRVPLWISFQMLLDAYKRIHKLKWQKKDEGNDILPQYRTQPGEINLYSMEKAGVSLAQRKQTAKKIFLSTHNCRNNGSTNKATAVKFRNLRKDAKMERSSCIDGFGAGLILTNQEGVEFTYAMRFTFKATNNEAEYEALIAGLQIAEQIGIKNLQAHVDSRLVANQVNGSYVAKESGMIQY